jgi:hypothetical protein
MRLSTTLRGTFYWVDHTGAVSISIPLDFAGEQPNLFGVPPAAATAVEAGDFVGDTSRGGSCNVRALTLIPHCHGTHTESVAHIVNEPVPVAAQIESFALLAALITVDPIALEETEDEYPGAKADDRVITAAAIEAALAMLGNAHFDALVVRTLPNEPAKRYAKYNAEPVPPFLTSQAIEGINRRETTHLLVDVPSIDRVFDDGKLANHHAFWNVRPGSRKLADDSRCDKTITEFVFVPNEVTDGAYILNLQVADFQLDAAPSRPMLIPLAEAVPGS